LRNLGALHANGLHGYDGLVGGVGCGGGIGCTGRAGGMKGRAQQRGAGERERNSGDAWP
jgi:hypothetical protein